MCRYTFINYKEDQTIVSIKPSTNGDDEDDAEKKPRVFAFNHEKVNSFMKISPNINPFIFLSSGIHIQYHR